MKRVLDMKKSGCKSDSGACASLWDLISEFRVSRDECS